MKIRNILLLGFASIFVFEFKTDAAEALARFSSYRTPSVAHLRPHMAQPSVSRLREQAPHSPQFVRSRSLHLSAPRSPALDIDRAASGIKYNLATQIQLPGYLPRILNPDIILEQRKRTILRFQPQVRFYSTASDLKVDWNKGHLPSRMPTQSEALVEDTHEDAANRIWHFDPSRSLFYYLREAGPENQNTQVQQPVKQDDNMVAYTLKKKVSTIRRLKTANK